MNESDSAKNKEIDKPDPDAKNKEIDKSDPDEVSIILKAITYITGTYLALREKPLPGLKRFFFSWLGSAAMFVDTPIKDLAKTAEIISEYIKSERPVTKYLFETISSDVTLAFINIVFVPSIFALVIASSKTKHGPIGLFLFGVMLSSFVLLLS